MKVKGRKYIALVTLISMLIASFIPAQSFAFEESNSEVLIAVEEMDEEDSEIIAEEEKNEKAEETEEASQTSVTAEAKEEEKTDSETVTEESKKESEEFSEAEKAVEKENIDSSKLMLEKGFTKMAVAVDNEVLGEAYGETGNTEPDKWYFGNELTIDEHFIFGEDRMYTEGKANRGFNCLLDNNTSVPFYVTTNDPDVNYQDLTGKEISVTFHTNSAVVIDHFKIISGGDTYKSNYAHRSPAAWSLKAGNSLDSCNTVLAKNLPVNATKAYEENNYEFENTTPYKYYKFTITALVGAGRSGHDSPFSNPTATCLLADILIGGPEETHEHDDGIKFNPWSSANSLPTEAGNYYLENDVTISSTWTVPQGTTNLCLNGHSITKVGNSSSVFYVGGGSTLNIYECDTTTHYYDINSTTHLAENINTTSGDYSFTGGYITGGMGYSGFGYRGGAILIRGGTVNINGGAIIGNKASGGEGGGIYIDYGTLSMDTGYIIGNYASSDGGGLQVTRNNSGYFYMTGGYIANNTAYSHGGGLTTYNVADISGGYIIGNQCFGGNKNNYKEGGGGIQTEAQGKLTIRGNVEISGNKSGMSGGGILVWGDCSYFRLSGSPIIKDNVAAYGGSTYSDDNIRLNGSKVITITDPLSPPNPIGVTVSSGSNAISSTGVFTSGLSENGTENSFTSDNSDYAVRLNGSGEAYLSKEIPGVTVDGYEGDYDGNAHSITVSAPEGATVKYGIEEGAYTLDSCPSYTDAGTYTVYYEVSKASYISSTGSATVKINKIDSVITTAPKTRGILNYNGSEQELIDEGTVTGGTFYYAIGDDESSPDDTEYKTEMPKASDAGYYYIWYKVKGDANHNDISPAYIKTTLAEEGWVTVSGAVYDSANIPVGNATVKLMQGNKTVDKMRSDSDGGYYFAVPAGLYNIVIKTDDATITNMVDVPESITKDIDVSDSCTESLLDVVNSDKSIVVGGLNEEAYAIRAGDSVSADKSVAVKLTVKSISEDDTEGAKKIAEDEADKNLEFFDLKVEKNVDSTVTELTETQNILEFAIPCPYTNKKGLVAYHYHGSEVLTLTQISSKAEKADGTFYVDKEKKMMYVYLSRFSTIAMGYTPYYRVKSNISLGDFTGNVSVTLEKVGSSEKYELNDVSLDNISFSDIPKGEYTMSIKWEDGAVNTLPSVSISVK